MGGYISREAALSAQNKSMNLSECRKRLERIPAADVRPVVLCLHCKNWDTSWAPNCGKEYGHFCPMVGNVTRADWFCAYGEKREES